MIWFEVSKQDRRAAELELADRHYSRQTKGSRQFMPPGKTLVLLTRDELAVWGACKNKDPVGEVRLRCTIFRNESVTLSSELVELATALTYLRFGRDVILTTEIDTRKTRKKRDPGRCFRKAGWIVSERKSRSHRHRHVVILEAPIPH